MYYSVKGLLLLSFVIIIEFCIVLLYAHALVLDYVIMYLSCVMSYNYVLFALM